VTGSAAYGESALLESVRLDDAWALVEELSQLVREAGSSDERQAVGQITARLDAWGIDYALHEPEQLIGLPGRASFSVEGQTFRAKTPSMSAPTGPGGLTAQLIYEPTAPAGSVGDLMVTATGSTDVAGRIVLTHGLPMPARIADLASRAAVGVVAISPGERIHEMVVTPIWGSPDLASWSRRPTLPVVSIARSDGDDLIARLDRSPLDATLVTEHDTGWRRVPVLVAEVPGRVEPERFVLVHGHLDSWHAGVGDNATGDATLLELARVLGQHRDRLARTVRIAWWSGHSQGRYAGSTWYADTHALDIETNCICHINCDSPGCRDANVFEDVFWMSELEAFAKQAIHDFAGQGSSGTSPPRGGDISFNNLGISTCFMLSSTMTAELRDKKGYYPVAGCGGNIEWHTEADTLEIADPGNLLRDMRVYAGAVFRAANSPVHPLDFRATVAQLEAVLAAHARDLGPLGDFASTFANLERLHEALEALYDRAEPTSIQAARPVNDALIEISRELVRILYCSSGRYRQEPALHGHILPDLAAAAEALGTVPDGVIRTEAIRVRNRVDRALLNAICAAESIGATPPERQ
jgi:N-acetylated-alpha-linked acidic dipeptidase